MLEQRRVERAKEALLSVDRVDARNRIERAVISATPPEQPDAENSSDLDDFLDDKVMQQYRQQRLEQLKRETRLRQEQSASGLGKLCHVAEAEAMESICERDGVTVIHLCEEGTAVGHDTDEHLTTLAHRQKRVKFLSVPLTRRSRLPPELGLPHASALLVFRNGALTHKAPTAQFTAEGSLLEERVSAWLRQPTKSEGNVADDAAGLESSDSEGDADDWREPCEICGRRYYHQHITPKTLYQSTRREDDADSS